MSRRQRGLRGALWLTLLGWASAACGTRGLIESAEKAAAKRVLVRLSASEDSNQSRPVYYMIRAVGDESGFSEGYDAALARALSEPLDPSVLARGLVRPHESLELPLTPSEDVDLGVYVFFTQRNSTFKLRVPKPVPRLLALRIERSGIQAPGQEPAR